MFAGDGERLSLAVSSSKVPMNGPTIRKEASESEWRSDITYSKGHTFRRAAVESIRLEEPVTRSAAFERNFVTEHHPTSVKVSCGWR